MTSDGLFYFCGTGLIVLIVLLVKNPPRSSDDIVRGFFLALTIGWAGWPFVLWSAFFGGDELRLPRQSDADTTLPAFKRTREWMQFELVLATLIVATAASAFWIDSYPVLLLILATITALLGLAWISGRYFGDFPR